MKNKRITLRQFIEELRINWAPQISKKYWLTAIVSLNKLTFYAGRYITSINPRTIDRMKTDLLKHYERSTVRKTITTCKAAFNKAVEWGYLGTNPFQGIKSVRIPHKPVRTASEIDIIKLKKAAYRTIDRTIIWLALDGGLRAKEIACLHLNDINIAKGRIQVQDREDILVKSSAGNRTVYVTNREHLKDISEAIREAKKKRRSYPFYDRNADKLSQQQLRIRKRAGIKATLHDLRRTCASNMANAGVPPQVVKEYMGHENISTTLKYYTSIKQDSLLEARRKGDEYAAQQEGASGADSTVIHEAGHDKRQEAIVNHIIDRQHKGK